MLLNGDHALISRGPGGARSTEVTAASTGTSQGLSNSVMTLRLGHRAFLIPYSALPYLGRGLDLSLFDVASLQRAERGGRLPVTLHFHGRLHAPPGITVTRFEPGVADGYLTRSSAAKLGVALARQLASDHARGSYGTGGLFAGDLSIGLAGAPAPRVRPAFPMHTLTVTGTTPAGKPDTGDLVFVFDVNDPAALPSFGSFFDHGTAKYSVPTGTYWAMSAFSQPFDHGRLANLRLDVLPQFTVRASKTVHLDGRAANSKVAIATPRPAVIKAEAMTTIRSAPGAPATSVGWLVPFAGDSILVNPVRRHTTDGTLRSYTYAQLTSPPGRGIPYAYALNFVGPPGTIPPQRFTVRQADLATLSERYFQDRASTGAWEASGGTRYEILNAGTSTADVPLHLPGRLTMYLSARPAMLWETAYLAYRSLPFGQTAGGQASEPLVLHPGRHLSEIWNDYPLHPAPNSIFPGVDFGEVRSSADRSGDTLNLDLTAFSDNQPGHAGHGLLADLPGRTSPLRGSYALYQNGVKIAGGNALPVTGGFGDTQVSAKLKPGPSVVRFALTASRASSRYRLSAVSHDVWTWHTRRRPNVRLPQPWLCDFTVTSDRRCAVEPMMTLDYQVAGLDLFGRAHPGQQAISFTAGHIQLAPASRITRAAMTVSYDGGKTWHPARVTRISADKFRGVFTAPAGATVTVRTSAADAAGGTITETITSAYQTSAAGFPTHSASSSIRLSRPPSSRLRAACEPNRPGQARCLTLYEPQTAVNRAIAAGLSGPAAQPKGWGAQAIESAYKLPVSVDPHQTIAIVDAQSTPHLAADLAFYRKHYGLPPCLAQTGCLRIVNQKGQAAPLPAADPLGWGVEETLDVAMVSASCPLCKILVVEARSPAFADLAAAENTAVRLGAQVISNSYGGGENGFDQPYASAYHHPGHAIVASSGDEGFGAAISPANLATVTAVGGTQLTRASNSRGWTEHVWDTGGATGSGCSAYVAKPSWQHDPHCPGRTTADVSALAWNIALYDTSLRPIGLGPWLRIGGTSAAAPIIAGVIGLAGNAAHITPRYPYLHRTHLFDITSGNNTLFGPPNKACGDDYLCVARPGYDAPTGLGTPDGTGGF